MKLLEVIQAYYGLVWSGKDIGRITDLRADVIIRHDAIGEFAITGPLLT